ncbi:MAG: cytochrome P450 [Chloroflexi bacterium]|nr:cytochrome P450 [Chloroflexota bacterium]
MVTVEYNPWSPEAVANPYPMFKQLREQNPIQRMEVLDGWVLTRYDDVVRVLKDSRFSADRRNARTPLMAEALKAQEEMGPVANTQTMLSADPPEHTRLRGLVSKAFTPKVVDNMRVHIQDIVAGLLDEVQAKGSMDLIEDLAYPLPVIVIAEMLGVPPEERDTFKRWSDDLVANMGAPGMTPDPELMKRAQTSSNEMADYFRERIAERRKAPKEDLLSALIAAEERGEVLSEDEVLATCVLLLAAGNETTTNLIGNGMLALLRHPEQFQKLRDDASLTDTAVEELLRYDGPVQATARVANEDVDVGGQQVEKGQMVMCVIAAANRDPAHFDDPETLDIARKDNKHIAFGFGIHFCIGAPLARIEGQAAISALMRRMPNLRLENDEPAWNGNFILRGLRSLPVSF